MPTYTGLILTVGMTHEPVIFSIQQTAAKKVAFVCTPDSDKTLDAVFQSVPLAPSNWRKYIVPDSPEYIGKLCLEFHAAYRWLTETCGIPQEGIAADPTAGRKWMSSGATMIAAFLGLAMHYVDARFVGGKPDPATMKLVELGNAYDQTGFVEAEKGRILFNQYEFASAAEIFHRIKPSVSAQADLYAGLAVLASTLDRWDRFEHYEHSLLDEFMSAFRMLRRYVGSLDATTPSILTFVEEAEKIAEAIENLRLTPRPHIGLTVDVFMNARRRIAQQRYDDACARLYRTLESIPQYFLHTAYAINPAAPRYEHLTNKQQQAIENALGRLPTEIDLDVGFRILKALGHSVGDAVIVSSGKKETNVFSGLLQDRNHSILAHGFKPIGKDRVLQFADRISNLLGNSFGADYGEWETRLRLSVLPSLLV